MAEIVEKPKRFSETARDIVRRVFRFENAILVIVLVALIGVFSVVTKGLSTSRANVMNIIIQSSMRGVASIGQAFVMLAAGIDLSVGGVAILCAVLGSTLMTETPWQNIVGHPVSMYIAVPIMILMGASWGAVNGAAVSRIGMPPLIVTLAMWQISQGIAYNACGGETIIALPQSLAFFGSGIVAGIPVPIIIFVTVCVIGYFLLNHMHIGRSIYAVGGNIVSAWLSGIDVKKIQFMTYVVSGGLAALGGLIMTGRIMCASMMTATGLEIDTIAAVTIGGVSLEGGKGSVIGVIIGVLILGVINNTMSILGANPATVLIVKGVIIFTAVAIDHIRRR